VRWRPHQALHCLSTPPAGTGKTALLRDALRGLDADAWAHTTIPLNSKHDGPSLQALLEVPLEKKAGKAVARVRRAVLSLGRLCMEHYHPEPSCATATACRAL
jgi:hypothetical protein